MISFLYVQTVRHRGYFLSAEGDEAHALPEEGQTYAHVVRQSYNATHSNASNWYDRGARHYRCYEVVSFFCRVVLKVYNTSRLLLLILSKELP